MISLVRAEVRKYFTTRVSWAMPLAMFVLGAAFAALQGVFLVQLGSMQVADGTTIEPTELFDDETIARMVYGGGVQIGYLLALVLGILSMSGEYRHKTITATLLSSPRRGKLIAGKLVALIIVVALNALAFVAGSILGGGAMLASGGISLFPDVGGLLITFARMVLVLVLWGLMGFGLGVLIPNQVVALFVGVLFTLLIEPLLGFGLTFVEALQDASRYFPSQASMSALDLFAGIDPETAQALGSTGDALTWWVACLVLLGYAVVMSALGWILTTRRDVA